jgi:GTPase SAR1 family protein
MIVFMSGPPHVGKSSFIEMLLHYIKDVDVTVVDPKQFLPEEYTTADETTRTELNICAWQVALEELSTLITNKVANDVVILDTCGSSHDSMAPLFINAKLSGHPIVYISMDADDDKLEEYGADKFLGAGIINKYRTSLRSTIPSLARKADRYFSIENNKTGLENLAPWVCRVGREIKNLVLRHNLSGR